MSAFLKKRREVMLLDLKDLTYRDIPIITEQPRGFITRKVENLITNYWKGGPGWNGNKVRYLGVKGYAVTSWINEAETKTEGTIQEFLRFVWGKNPDGKDIYDSLKPEQRTPLEKQIGVIVTVKPDLSADDNAKYMIDALTAEAMLKDVTNDNLQGLGKNEEKKVWTQSLAEKIPWIAVGLAIDFCLRMFKIWA